MVAQKWEEGVASFQYPLKGHTPSGVPSTTRPYLLKFHQLSAGSQAFNMWTFGEYLQPKP
jgi:hypothetical protein